MADKNRYIPEAQWDIPLKKRKFASLSLRAAWDQRQLKKTFALTKKSPVLAEALAWAEQHGIKFVLDPKAVNVGGYYLPGTGVIALHADVLKSEVVAANTLAHEIRHAWQDYNGLLRWDGERANQSSFSDFYLNNSLMEADAYATGELAQQQVMAWMTAQNNDETYEQALAYCIPDEAALLRKRFLHWFNEEKFTWPGMDKFEEDLFSKRIREIYGDKFSKAYGREWGVYEGDVPTHNQKYRTAAIPDKPGLDSYDIQDVLRLGVSFSGGHNYLAGLQNDILRKEILRPSLANTFWGAASDEQKKLTTELRKAYLKKKTLPENRKPRHPWP